MENLIFLFATSFVLRLSTARKLRNYFIGDTGCSVMLLPSCRNFEKVSTKNGDNVYFTEFKEDKVKYGIICITLNTDYAEDRGEALMVNYLNKLRKSFFILHHTGLQPSIDWNSRNSVAFEDYWQDIDGNDWKIKAYSNGHAMSILYVKNINDLDVKKQDLFLDSFYFHKNTERLMLAPTAVKK